VLSIEYLLLIGREVGKDKIIVDNVIELTVAAF